MPRPLVHRPRLRLLVAAAALVIGAIGCVPRAGTVELTEAPAPVGCITDVSATVRRVFADCGGGLTYSVSVPEVCATHACGLILDVHGWTMSADIQEANTQIAAIARTKGYVVVQPTAPGSPPSWNSSHYPLVASFVEQAIQAWRIETRRVHVTGFSQGGAMTFWMRCNRSDLFASAAPTAMSGTACTNGVNMPTLYIQGVDDIFVSQAAIDSTIASFVNRYGLDRADVLLDEGGILGTIRWSSAPDVPTFQTVIHQHTSYGVQGHCILGAPDPANAYGCDQEAAYTHGELVVRFFQDNPRA